MCKTFTYFKNKCIDNTHINNIYIAYNKNSNNHKEELCPYGTCNTPGDCNCDF